MVNPLAAPFACHLAHLLTTPDAPGAPVRAKPWALRLRFEALLATPRYAAGLVGARTMGLDPFSADEAERAAQRWVERVLERPLALHPSRDRTRAHDVLEALAARGPFDPPARLARSGASDPALCVPGAGMARGLLDRLRRLPPGARARRTERDGPLILTLGGAAAIVPDDLSLWAALTLAPAEMAALSGDGARVFRHLLVRAVETADEPWNALRRLGLSPPDWIDSVPINRAKAAGALITAAGGRRARQALEAAWTRRPIPGFETAAAFFETDFGRALLSPPAPTREAAALDVETLADTLAAPASDAAPDPAEAAAAVERLRSWKALPAEDLELMDAIVRGATLAELHREPAVRRRHPSLAHLISHTDKMISAALGAYAERRGDAADG